MTAPEAKDIDAIKDDIKSIRVHLHNIKTKQDDRDLSNISLTTKIEIIYNSLVDNDFNGNSGIVGKVSNHERKLIIHDMYWKIAYVLLIPAYIAIVTILLKLFIK